MGNNKQIAKNLFFSIGSFGVNLFISFFFTPYLIQVVGKEAYSFFPLVNNIISYSNIITIAISSMAGRFITIRLYNGDIEGANKYFNSALFANIILSVIFSIIACVTTCYLDHILTIPARLIYEVKWLFALGSLSLILIILTSVLGVGTYVKNRLDWQASRTVISNFIRITIILVLFWIFYPSIVYMSLSAVIASIYIAYYNIRFKKKLLPELDFSIKKNFSYSALREMLSSGIWNSLNQLSHVLLSQIDLLITNVFIGAVATADFSIAKTAPLLILNLLTIIASAFGPLFNISYAKGDYVQLIRELNKSIVFVGLFIALPIGFLLVYAGDFFKLWISTAYNENIYWLSFLTVLPMIFGASINPIYNIFTVINKLKTPSLVLLISGICYAIMIFILLRTTNIGIWIIPIASAVQQIARNFFFTPIYAAKCLHQKWFSFYQAQIKGILALVITIIFCLTTKALFVPSSWSLMIVSLILVSLSSLIINFFIILKRSEREHIYRIVTKKISHLNNK